MSDRRSPALYQIDARVWPTELSQELGRLATLEDMPDADGDATGCRRTSPRAALEAAAVCAPAVPG